MLKTQGIGFTLSLLCVLEAEDVGEVMVYRIPIGLIATAVQ